MKLHADKPSGNYIQSFDTGTLRINGQLYRTPVIVSVDTLISSWTPGPVESMTEADFSAALELDPEVILLGTGIAHRFANAYLTASIMRRGVGFETMTTSAACRTFNVLAGEDRRVVAALLVT